RKAKEWVASVCDWEQVAQQHVKFLNSLGRPAPQPASYTQSSTGQWEKYLSQWMPLSPGQSQYFEEHAPRLARTLQLTPPGSAEDSILEMGCYMQLTPALQNILGYGAVRGAYLGAGGADHKTALSRDGQTFSCTIDLFDAEVHTFPYTSNHFSTVLCCELLEHLQHDPMWMLSEIHRVLKPGGVLLLTTPNVISARAVATVVLNGP